MKLTIKTADDLAREGLDAARATIAQAIDARIEGQARALGYNSAAHLAGYATSTVPDWQAEAQAFIAWRDAVWVQAFKLEGSAKTKRRAPEIAAVLDALPPWTAPR